MAEPAFKPKEIIDVEIPRSGSFLLKAGIATVICSLLAVAIVKKRQQKIAAPKTEWIMLAAGRNCVEKMGRFDCVGMTLNLGLRSDGVVVWQ